MKLEIQTTEYKEIDIPNVSDLGKITSIFHNRANFILYIDKDEKGFDMEITHKPSIGPGYLMKHRFDNDFNLIY
jgi:hypothetical protein